MKTWKCDVCGYVHKGEKVPDLCPVCGVEHDHFSPLEIQTSAPVVVESNLWLCPVCGYRHHGPKPTDCCPVCSVPANLFEPLSDVESRCTANHGGKVVIVGAGIAAVTAAEALRQVDDEAEVVLLGREPHPPYYRLNLTRFLAGDITTATLPLQSPEWYSTLRLELRHGEVESIDPEGHCLKLANGERIDYNRLILANGSHAFVPPIPGATRNNVLTLRTLDDAKLILEKATTARHVVCLGGGLLGLETAGALNKHNCSVTVLEGGPSLLPRQLPLRGGEVLRRRVEEKGIKIIRQAQIEAIVGDEAVKGLLLADGREIPADLLIVTAGVRPNSYLARQAGLKVRSGVLVDDSMRTSHPDIFAAGDVAEHRGRLFGLWPVSFAQGEIAGRNVAGEKVDFSGMPPSTRLKVLDIDLFSIGTLTADDASFSLHEYESDCSYAALLCRDGFLAGAALVGDLSLAALLSDALKDQTPLPELGALLSIFPRLSVATA
ncbi:MAG: pyridine nucleotide-disulfide oxidoreductase [Desulfuromonas sp.]|nr:MAG: pyridine nucleotide-disulfide oxidoreductase [Desulfuromonas sp.]